MSEEGIELGELYQIAHLLPYGEAKVSLFEELVKAVDETQIPEAMFEVRMALSNAAIFSGSPEKTLASFAWCLSKYEEAPDRYADEQHNLLWHFKWILENSIEFPQMTREQIEGVFKQMETLYRQCGYNMRPVYNMRFVRALCVGDREAATKYMKMYQDVPRDDLADCEACESDNVTEYYCLMDEVEKAVENAQPNLNGLLSCEEVPQRVLNYMLYPLSKLGRYKEADKYRRRGYRMIHKNRSFLRHLALNMAYLSHRGRADKAVGMIEKHLPWALEGLGQFSRYFFYLASIRALRGVAEKRKTVKLKLPDSFLAYQASGKYEVNALADWFDGECKSIGARFDQRHDTTYFTKELPARMNY